MTKPKWWQKILCVVIILALQALMMLADAWMWTETASA